MSVPITATTIRALLKKHLSPDEWCLAFEVTAQATKGERRADAVAMNLWPSRGNVLRGYEFKVSRADWRSELKNPAKAEPIAQYCDHWYLVTPPNIIKPGELPETWGHLIAADDTLVVAKEAPKKPSIPVDRPFMAALFRRLAVVESDDFDQAVATQREIIRVEYSRQETKLRDDHANALESAALWEKGRHETLYKRLSEFEAETGLSLENLAQYGNELGPAVRFVLQCKLHGSWASVDRLRKTMRESLAVLDEALGEDEPAATPAVDPATLPWAKASRG